MGFDWKFSLGYYVSDTRLAFMAMTPEGQIWIYIFLHYVKRFIETVLCIWVANYGMICLSSYKILRILNHLNIITECINVSLAHDRIDISQFLYEVMIISLLPESSILYMDMNFCILSGMGWSSILFYVIYVSLLYMIRIYILKVIHMFYFDLLPNGSTV